MNAVVHSESFAKKYGGRMEDFYYLNDLMDCSKEIESSNLHRIYFHNLFGIKNYIIPIVGHTITTSEGKKVNVKDAAELHCLQDYQMRFIPTLADFVDLCEDSSFDKQLIETFQHENREFFKTCPQVKTLMMEPLFNTGKMKSLLLTHNSWFINKILPLIFKDIKVELKDYNIAPSVFFNRCKYADWLDNGRSGTPPSFKKIEESRKTKIKHSEPVYDDGLKPYKGNIQLPSILD